MAWPRLLQFLRLPLLRRLTDGERGERVAARFLRQHRYRILARNLRTTLGEVDLLAESPDGRFIVIVEVKARALSQSSTSQDVNQQGPRPEEHVNAAKQRKLTALASQIARRFKLQNRPIRFDVIGVDLHSNGDHTVRHHVAAFESNI